MIIMDRDENFPIDFDLHYKQMCGKLLRTLGPTYKGYKNPTYNRVMGALLHFYLSS